MKPGTREPLRPDDESLGRAFDRRLMRRLLRYSLPYRQWMGTALVLILVTTALGLAGPFIVKWAIDGPLHQALAEGQAADGDTWSAGSAARGLYVAALLYLLVALINLFLRYHQGMAMSRVGQRVMHDLRMQVFGHLQRLSVGFYDRNPVGRLTTRVTNDIESLSAVFTSGVVTFAADLAVLVGITAALVWVNLSLALVTLLVLPPLFLATMVFRNFAQRYYREQRGHLAHLNAFSQEALQGLTIIQLFTRELKTSQRFRTINQRYFTAFKRTVLCYSLYFPAVEFVGAGALAAILLVGGSMIRTGDLTFGEFYLFWTFLGKFMAPIRDMAERYNVLQSAMAAGERIFRVLDTPAPRRELPPSDGGSPSGRGTGQKVEPLKGNVEFRDVWFSYEADHAEGRFAARGISFSVRQGESVAIVGATGAGKSTLVNLLTRFYEPQRGQILIDGRDLGSYPVHQLRNRMGLVLQDPFLFSRTIRENIRFAREEISDETVVEAARRTHALEVITRLPLGWDTVLGERGGGLSSGEKQLLVFARALAGDPDILILDEATSFVDPTTETLIQEAVKELLVGRTAIVIAHRLSTIREADRIVVLHKGEIREVGNHQELLLKKGIYEHLYRLQLKSHDPGGKTPRPGIPSLPSPPAERSESGDDEGLEGLDSYS